MGSIRRACPYLFLLLCLASALFQAWNLPPFQGADELAHAYRADMTTFGLLSGERVQRKNLVAGGPTDVSLFEATGPFDSIRFHLEQKADAADYDAAAKIVWDGRTTRTGYPGSAIYPPFFYMPSAAGMALGKLLDWPVVQSIYLARAASALVCALVGFAALMIAGRSRLWMFTVLLLPMSVALYATLTNDGLMIVTTALGCAVISRGMHEGRPLRRDEVIWATACFALVGMTKLPYALLGLVFLVSDTERPRWRHVAAATVLGTSFLWTLWTALAVQTALTPPGSGINPGLQLHWLLAHPWAVLPIAAETLTKNIHPYANMFVGVLGWLDTFLPAAYYYAAWMLLPVALLAAVSRGHAPAWRGVPIVAALIVLATFAAIHGALYLSWNVVAATYVQGVQGRYFLPLALLVGLVVEGERPLLPPGRWSDLAYRAAGAVVLAFPLVSLLVVEHTIVVRYYLD